MDKNTAQVCVVRQGIVSIFTQNPLIFEQVTPLELTSKMMEAAIAAGVRLLIDSAVDVAMHDGAIQAVQLSSGATLPADKLAICLGPWSGVAVEDWFDLPLPIEGVKSTSLVYRNLQEVKDEPFACFCGEDDNGCHLELYPRINGLLYDVHKDT